MAASGKWIDGLSPETKVVDAARRSLEARLAVVAHCLPLAAHLAEHDIEHVHQLRVATRRATAALRLYRDCLPRKSRRWMKKQLRKIRRAAGDARDLDVLTERLRRDSVTSAGQIVHCLAAKRTALQPAIVTLAEDLRREDLFVRKAGRLVHKVAPADADGKSASPETLSDWAPPTFAKIACRFVDQMPEEVSDVGIPSLHEFRIRAKALRYAIELLAPAFGSQMREELYPAIEELQEQLGAITDHTAALKLLDECRSQGSDPLKSAAHELHQIEKQQQCEDLQNFQHWWSSERGESLKRALGEQASMPCV